MFLTGTCCTCCCIAWTVVGAVERVWIVWQAGVRTRWCWMVTGWIWGDVTILCICGWRTEKRRWVIYNSMKKRLCTIFFLLCLSYLGNQGMDSGGRWQDFGSVVHHWRQSLQFGVPGSGLAEMSGNGSGPKCGLGSFGSAQRSPVCASVFN